MSLPKISSPIFTTTLPSSGEKVKYRPFTVKEEKILLIARETADIDQIVLATQQVINNCIIDVDATKLPTFDIEWLLLHVRAASVDGQVKFNIPDPDTKENVELEFSIDDVKVYRNPDHTTNIRVSDDYVVFMRYPTIEESFMLFRAAAQQHALNKELVNATKDKDKERIRKELQDLSKNAVEYDIMINCLDKLVGEDEVYDFSKATKQEINEFVDSLEPKAIKRIQNFFETMPNIRHEIHYKNSKGDDKTFVIQGFDSFFT
jgi:hypothetical protein